MTGTTGVTSVGFSCYCSDGTSHIFSGTAGTAGSTSELTSIINSSGVGNVLQGKTIVQAWVSSTADWDAAESGGNPFVALLAANGQTKCSWLQQFPVYAQPMPQMINAAVALNDTLQIDTDTA